MKIGPPCAGVITTRFTVGLARFPPNFSHFLPVLTVLSSLTLLTGFYLGVGSLLLGPEWCVSCLSAPFLLSLDTFLPECAYKPVGRARSLSGQKGQQHTPFGSPDAGDPPVSLLADRLGAGPPVGASSFIMLINVRFRNVRTVVPSSEAEGGRRGCPGGGWEYLYIPSGWVWCIYSLYPEGNSPAPWLYLSIPCTALARCHRHSRICVSRVNS